VDPEYGAARIEDIALVGLPGESITEAASCRPAADIEVAQGVEKAVIAKRSPKAIAIGLANDYNGGGFLPSSPRKRG